MGHSSRDGETGSMASGSHTARAVAPDESPHTGAVTFGKWIAFANPAQLEVSYGEKSPNLCLLPPSKLPVVQLNPMGNPKEKGVAHRAGWRGKSGYGGARKHSVQSLPCTRHEQHRAAVPAGCSEAQRGTASISRPINSKRNTDYFHAHNKHLLKIHHELVIK